MTSIHTMTKVRKVEVDLDAIIDETAKESYDEWKNLGSDDNE